MPMNDKGEGKTLRNAMAAALVERFMHRRNVAFTYLRPERRIFVIVTPPTARLSSAAWHDPNTSVYTSNGINGCNAVLGFSDSGRCQAVVEQLNHVRRDSDDTAVCSVASADLCDVAHLAAEMLHLPLFVVIDEDNAFLRMPT